MGRSEARIAIAIWQDQDFLALPVEAQRMYLFLLSQPDLSHCGVIPLRTSWWSSSAAGLTAKAVCDALLILEKTAPPFVIIDKETQELLVRSLVRRDRILKQPKMIKPLGQALSGVGSKALRRVLATEIRRVLDLGDEDVIHPDLHETAESMVKHLESPGGYPIRYPIGKAIRYPSRYPQGKGQGLKPLPPSPEVPPVTTPGGVVTSPRVSPADAGKCQGKTREGKPCSFNAYENGYCGRHDPSPKGEDPEFGRFWQFFPLKKAKRAALMAWEAAERRGMDKAEVVRAARRYASDPKRDPEYTCHASTWLNQERWNDSAQTSDGSEGFWDR